MKKPVIRYILIILVLQACKFDNHQFEKDIVGEWKFSNSVDLSKPIINDELLPPPPLHQNYIKGYIFSKDNICENKTGYFKRTEIKNFEDFEDNKTIYLGEKTKYKIEDDSLIILNLSNNKWQGTKILTITKDTLTLQINDSLLVKFSRSNYKTNPQEYYDQIIVSSSGCYGSCPILEICINRNGNVIYFGKDYNLLNGLFTSNITDKNYLEIENKFKKADIPNLKDQYVSGWTDQQEITITFIKGNKIVKTVKDYGMESPLELLWAYKPVIYLNQQIKLKPLQIDNPLLLSWNLSFDDGKEICELTKSERFYLITEILKGKEVVQKFDKKYKIQFWSKEDNKIAIQTDGRFFDFKDKIIDLGYNFLTANSLNTRFKKKIENN